jgi:hypothetical protein
VLNDKLWNKRKNDENRSQQYGYQGMGCIRNLSSSRACWSRPEFHNMGSSERLACVLPNGLSLVQRVSRRMLHDVPVGRRGSAGPLPRMLLLFDAANLDPPLRTYVLDDQRREGLCPKTSSATPTTDSPRSATPWLSMPTCTPPSQSTPQHPGVHLLLHRTTTSHTMDREIP